MAWLCTGDKPLSEWVSEWVNFRKFWFRTNLRKTSIFVKVSILVKLFENLDFAGSFAKKSRFCSKWSNIPILVKIFEKFWFQSKSLKTSIFVKYFWKSPLWSQFNKDFDFTENFRNSILVKIYEKFRFWSKFLKFSILVEIFGKFRCQWKFW